MKSIRRLAVLNAISLAIHIGFSYLTQFKIINVKDVGEVSADFPSLFTPAGITFAIWGLIYIALSIFVIYHIVQSRQETIFHPANEAVKRMGLWFIINNLATASWLVAFTREQIRLSVLLICVQLLSLIMIHSKLNIFNPRATAASRFLTQAPLSIYFAWICIATIANFSSWLASVNWGGFGINAVNWTLVMIGIAVVVSVLMIIVRRNVFFGLVVLWALYGIALKHESGNGIGDFEIERTAWIGVITVALITLLQMARNFVLVKTPQIPFPAANHSLK